MSEPKLKKVRRLDTIRLDAGDKTYFTDEGYLIDHPILTSCGIFEYTNPDGSIRRELRLPEHVFDENSLKSYKGKPIIITHDAGVVNKGNVDRESIGTILSEGYQDGDDVRAEIIIHDTDAMKQSGLKELSLGYNLDLIEKPGTWNGEPYDAIQTNITINHLALVASARAGEQARLNIDGSDEPELKGGKVNMAKNNTSHNDSGAMSPEELEKAIADYKKRKAERMPGKQEEEPTKDGEGSEEPEEEGEASEEKELTNDGEGEEKITDVGKSPADILASVKENRDRRDAEEDPEDTKSAMGVIAQQDSDIDQLIACLEAFLQEEKQEEAHGDEGEECEQGETKEDSSDDKSGSMNADSADDIIRQRLSICRVGDKLHMDGLENKSIMAGKKAIIAKVYPNMRMDGKSKAYIDAMYDLAVNEVSKRKGVDYQRAQMQGGKAPERRNDGKNKPTALSARQRMIEREGGNE